MEIILTFLAVLLVVVFASYIIYYTRSRTLEGIQRKPLLGANGYGYGDAEFSEDLSLDFKEPDYYLPPTYDMSRLVLLVKDPHWLFAYWEISEKTRQQFNQEMGDVNAWLKTAPALRVNEICHGQTVCCYDIPIHDEAFNWYIKVGKPNTSFMVEIGRVVHGSFFSLLKSNLVTTPAAGISAIIDPEWPPNDALWHTLRHALAPSKLTPGSEQLNPHTLNEKGLV